MEILTIRRPDDWHVHLRDGDALPCVVRHTAERFARALVMPNLRPPVTRVAEALAYRARILQALPHDTPFDPLMALYLTEDVPVEEVRRAAEEPRVLGFKLYPAGATTHSAAGIRSVERIYPVLEAMEKHDVALMVHGEVTDPAVDIFDREKAFVDRHLEPLINRFPALRISFEHITTRDAVQFVQGSPATIAATITAHHLLYNRNALLAGGIRPHYYCLPVLKREIHRQALIVAACSGYAKFFAGTDSAPHPRSQKEAACGCAGCYTANAALELYATVFDEAGRLDSFERFVSLNGASFYRLPVNEQWVTLEKRSWTVPETLRFGDGTLIPLKAGEAIPWQLRRTSGES